MKIRIYKPLTHNRVQLTPGPEGIEIDATAPEVEFLRERGVLDPPTDENRTTILAPKRRQSFAIPEAAYGNDLDQDTSAETKRTSI